ncbi:alpha/beta fold hydrolase [Thalassoroseus pseudoceratinae]|uniref:alpha/beta fold hydrolase n=1 Tax=Thalassoroseus pseudoceratinae TaxID=2713176 RepID=UPI0014249E05|nr:alpha/beta hydrolase [Thalassoroseus pseudoceratinae]
MTVDSTSETLNDAVGEPCPTPLSTGEVLNEFRSKAEPWTVTSGGQKWTGKIWGHGPSVYFLGGFLGTTDQFAFLTYLLKDDFRCVTFEHPAKLPSPRDWASSLATIADELGDDTWTIYASSFGSLPTWQLLTSLPDRVQGAVVQGGFAQWRLSLAERALALGANICPGRITSLPGREAVARQNHRSWFPPFDQVRWPFYLENSGETPVRVLGQRARWAHRHNFRALLPQIQQPVLVIRTEGDGSVLEAHQEELRELLPNVSSEKLNTSGQLPHITHPHRVAKLISTFEDDQA